MIRPLDTVLPYDASILSIYIFFQSVYDPFSMNWKWKKHRLLNIFSIFNTMYTYVLCMHVLFKLPKPFFLKKRSSSSWTHPTLKVFVEMRSSFLTFLYGLEIAAVWEMGEALSGTLGKKFIGLSWTRRSLHTPPK